jgi:anti-sigma B factor antagonist
MHVAESFRMNLQVSEHDGVQVVAIKHARLDASMALDFRAQLNKLVDDGSKRFVLDMSAVSFVDSSGLGAIVSVLKHTGSTGSIAIAGAQETVGTLFKVTRMDKVFKMFTTLASAAEALKA